jgi:type II secretory pathway pseudopilin PulG
MNERAKIMGMTLVEILAGLVILSILAIVTLRYLGVSLTASGTAVQQLRDVEAVTTVMERITVNYTRLLETDTSPLSSLKSAIGPEGSTQSNTYGEYDVVTNSFIAFDGSGNEVSDNTQLNVLKVKVQVGNRRMVALFTN